MDSTEDKMSIEYINSYPNLPANAPFGHPHIIDSERLDVVLYVYLISIADLVVTILFKLKPGALTAFLDLKRPNFHYIQAGSGDRSDFCIKRDGRIVTVRVSQIRWRRFELIGPFQIGFLNGKEKGGWEKAHKYSIDKESTKPWTPVSMKREDGHSETNAEKVARGASKFVWNVLGVHKVWRGGHVVEMVCGLLDGQSFQGRGWLRFLSNKAEVALV